MLDKDRQQHIQDSIPFISEDSDLYLIKIDLEMDWRKYRETTGLPMWHRRLMHCSFQNIKDTIPFTKGMEKLKNCRIDPQEKCPACAIGKSTLQDNPGPISRATQPLAKANFDVIVSSIVSIEGYNYAALLSTTALVSVAFPMALSLWYEDSRSGCGCGKEMDGGDW